jgi:ribose transport system permease protein
VRRCFWRRQWAASWRSRAFRRLGVGSPCSRWEDCSGAFNASAIAWLRLLPFVVTLATMNIGRGLALELSRTRAMNLPSEFLALGRPVVAISIMAVVVIVVHGMLSLTRVGRHVHALGESESVAINSGLSPGRLRFFVFTACGLCAGLAALLTLGQLGAVSPKFGEGREFTAIAAAVLGGTSLFGGRGAVFPGTVAGAVLMQSIESGLVMINADPYAFPVILGGVIFLAVVLDAWKGRIGTSWWRRKPGHSPVGLPH